ncbi:MAG TPA: chromosome segregation protein SMC, partial [Chloroflexota bacterium]|nr:chromosome segregation protein SMC [Chloroflexota bacterium]
MYLKRLELQGFKTFASRTVFEFAPGMTAVVGPNGSGKSNLADALRWVLGEQSLRALRCKKTEDVVFAGGAGKPPAGMAEVSITFDNTAGWLDTPFQEVVVTRRAYRSGENEYLINRDRVRLRDVADLLLKANISPNGYTIIGQGMVDLALSLKAEERRELFEDAAGIRHHYVKLNEARGRLATTEVNLSRVRDVIAEIEPRLKSLERRARQLRERDAVRAELRAHLAAWYGHRWLQGRAEVEAAEQAEREAAAALAEARAAADATAEEASTLARRQNELRGRLAEIERARVDLLGQGERLERELALRHERANAARARIVELRAEVDELAARAAADEAALRTTRSHLERLEADVARLSAEVAAAEGANDERRQRADRLRAQLQEAQALQLRLNQEEAALRAELEKVAPRRAELQAEISRQTEAAAQDEERALAVRAEIDRHEAAMAEAEAAAKQAEAEAERLRVELASCRLHQETIALRVAELARERAAVQGRLDVLTDAREGYAGYYAGVRAVLAAARDVGARGREAARTAASPARRIQTSEGRLEGIVGLVASLVRVPPHLETAIEVALGSHLQDLVVERWEHAEAAVAFLKKTNAGRATFLPLDTVRGGASPPPVGAGAGPGVLGVASALAQFDEPYRAVMEHLLGRTLVVQDLPTARQALRSIGGGWQIVTLGGEVVRSSGAITGGAGQGADRTLLARERERRELPERLAAAVASGKSAESELAGLRAHQVELEAALRRVGEARVAAERRAAAARVERGAAAARAERLAREVEWSRGMTERARAELAALDEVERATRERLAALPEHGGEHAQLAATLRARLAELDSAMREQDEQLSRVRSSVAVIEGERRAHTRLLESHAERRERIAAEIEARRRRIDELTGSAAALDGEAEEIEAARGALEDQRAALAAEAEPIQRELAELAEQARLIAAGEPAGRAQLNELADKVRAVALAAQSARDHL